ncbi:MAG TPA: hypothetical protein VK622_08955, partial [Puia sp.]|nr:hypothetical protein [Puia sp.]
MNLKKLKPVHWIYNLIHYKAFRHNRDAYRKYELNKPLIASVSSKDFPDKESKAWLDLGDSRILASLKPAFASFPISLQEKILSWSDNGYMIIERLFSEEAVDKINDEIDMLIRKKKLHFNSSHKLLFANRKSGLIKSITKDPLLHSVLEFIL